VVAARGRDAIARIRAQKSSAASGNGRPGGSINKALKGAQIIEIAIVTIGAECVSSSAA
jgi:hypothetical protein